MNSFFSIPVIAVSLILVGTAAEADNSRDQKTDAGSQAMIFGTDLIHEKVLNNDGREIGHVDELLIDPANGKIRSVVVSVGTGFMGVGNKSVTIPWDKLHTSATTDGYQVTLDEGMLREAPVYNRPVANGAGRTPEQTMRGTVVSLEAVPQNNNETSFNALTVRTDQGVFTVQTSRDWLTHKDDLNVKTGDQVIIKGFVTGIGDRRAIVAEEISDNGKTARLSTEGLPYRETSGEQTPAGQ